MKYNIADSMEDYLAKEKISFRELGRRLNIDSKQFAKYLTGTLPKISTAIKIANYLNCSLDYLFSFNSKYEKITIERQLDNENFYDKYQKLLDENNLTHFSLCKKLNISETNLKSLKAHKLPCTETLLMIADFFGVSINYLVCKNKI